jgi:Protein of unknown function (DUF3047)
MKFAMKNVAIYAYSTGLIGIFCIFWMAASLSTTARAQTLQPFSSATVGAPPTPWRVVGLPGNKVPLAQVDIAALDGRNVLRLRTDKSYGTASHALPAGTVATTLQWQWRVDQGVDRSVCHVRPAFGGSGLCGTQPDALGSQRQR